MTKHDDDLLSPTVTKVLDEYLAALKSDKAIDESAANRLNALLRKGKVPKPDDIDAVLFPADHGNATS